MGEKIFECVWCRQYANSIFKNKGQTVLSTKETKGRKGQTSPAALLREATCKLTRSDFDRLNRLAQKTQRSRGSIVRDAINAYLKSHEQSAKSKAAV